MEAVDGYFKDQFNQASQFDDSNFSLKEKLAFGALEGATKGLVDVGTRQAFNIYNMKQ